MKKIIKIICGLTIILSLGLLTGCDEQDNVSNNTNNTNSSEITYSNNYQIIDKETSSRTNFTMFTVVDTRTNIIYIICEYKLRGGGLSMSVMYNAEGKPMTLEEYQNLDK